MPDIKPTQIPLNIPPLFKKSPPTNIFTLQNKYIKENQNQIRKVILVYKNTIIELFSFLYIIENRGDYFGNTEHCTG